MIPTDRFRQIAQALLSKTKAGEANWERLAPADELAYKVSLPKATIVLSYHRPRARFDYITLQFLDPSGTEVGSWKAEVYDPEDPTSPEEAEDWDLLHSLFAEVHRHVTGWDKTLNNIERAVAGPGPIGAPIRN